MFLRLDGEVFRVLFQGEIGAWVVSTERYQMPTFLDGEAFCKAERVEAPPEFVNNHQRELSKAEKNRLALIEVVINDERCLTDEGRRNEVLRRLATEKGTTVSETSAIGSSLSTEGGYITTSKL